jgi:hypothetical protein
MEQWVWQTRFQYVQQKSPTVGVVFLKKLVGKTKALWEISD